MMEVCQEPRIMVNLILYTRSMLRELGGESKQTENFLKLLKFANFQIQETQQVLSRIK